MKQFFQSLYQRRAARAMFATWSLTYEEDVTTSQYSAADKVAEAAIKHIATLDRHEPTIADIGIGTGLLAQQIYEALPCRITGIDFTDDMLAVCQQKAIAQILIKCDAGKDRWPLEPGSYDAVVSAGLLEYFTPDMTQHFLKESVHCLNQGGLLIFSYIPTENPKGQMDLWQGKSGNFLSCRYNPVSLIGTLGGLGFEIVDHSEEFTGSVFRDGSTYPYRLIVARKN